MRGIIDQVVPLGMFFLPPTARRLHMLIVPDFAEDGRHGSSSGSTLIKLFSLLAAVDAARFHEHTNQTKIVSFFILSVVSNTDPLRPRTKKTKHNDASDNYFPLMVSTIIGWCSPE